jgi:hypothetical protein
LIAAIPDNGEAFGERWLEILLAKCVKNARDHIKRDAALEMEADPPKTRKLGVDQAF